MPDEIRVECTKVRQGGMEFYAFVANSRDLREIAFVSRRDIDNPHGYQRYLSAKRLKEIGEYIKKPRATFPNTIIVNLDPGKARFEHASDGRRGTMVIPKEQGVAWIIDGQHRLYGFEHSEGKEFDLLVAAFLGLALPDQATVFKVINSTQTGVSPSLIYDLIDLTKDADYQDERAHEIVKSLNEDADSPWQGHVKMLGTGKGIISQAALIGEFKRLLQDAIFEEYAVGEQVRILKNYFGALKTLFPDAWGSKRHVLCKTLGTAAVLMIMPKVLIHCQIHNDFALSRMRDVLQRLPSVKVPGRTGAHEVIDFSGKQLGAFGGRQGQRRLAEILGNALPPLRPTQ